MGALGAVNNGDLNVIVAQSAMRYRFHLLGRMNIRRPRISGGCTICHIRVGNCTVLAAEHDLGGPALDLLTVVLVSGDAILASFWPYADAKRRQLIRTAAYEPRRSMLSLDPPREFG